MPIISRVGSALAARARVARSLPLANWDALGELVLERRGHSVDQAHLPHLREAMGWLCRAQDATSDGGFARGFSVAYSSYFRSRGWQPAYPETTGYIIPTLFHAARTLDAPELTGRALRAADWEIAIQLPSGAVQGGVVGEGRSPAIFNTGQVMFGWLAAFETTGEGRFADALRRAGRFLVASLDQEGEWRGGESNFARKDSTLYNARVSWALAEAGQALGDSSFLEAAGRNLRMVSTRQAPNGWFPRCCLTDPVRPLLHTLAYTIRGLLEGGRVLRDETLIAAAARAAAALIERVESDGRLPGRFAADWSPAADWSCLTGNAQMANNWMRLNAITGDNAWRRAVPQVLDYLKRTQNRSSGNPGLRGGIKGSAPFSGGYGRYEILNWATKYFADALMRHEAQERATAVPAGDPFRLA